MDIYTRRKFLLASGVAGAGALAVGGGGLLLSELLGTASSTPESSKKLVIVTLYGGNDGLSMVVPYADAAYQSARPGLAYAPEQVLHLDDSYGLNPKLPGLKRLWDSKRLAIVQAVGYPKPDRSHFRSMDIWQTASPDKPIGRGWVGHWLDATNAPVEAAVSFEPVLPPLLAGETRSGACVSMGGLKLPSWVGLNDLEPLGKRALESGLQAQAANAIADLIRADRMVRQASLVTPSEGPDDLPPLPAVGTGGETTLAGQLTNVIHCIEAGVPTRVYSVSLGGFDTHAAERVGQERLFKQLDESLTPFVERLAKTAAGQHTTVLVYSEFGRRVAGNAAEGTDHGAAGPVLVLGPQVAGGLYGQPPSLTDLDDGDLRATTDFRDVIGTLLSSVLEADPARFLNGYPHKQLPLL
ncbi:hypothetical protein Rhe02_26060 [Rhizocola hellebori]|uniref:DUF1501 domain-containing protein n=1 Tax=Rhizocola hellebori TaxID=1392758 RepID=A0A8J3VEJ2_9ACTN|nr:DUF1501 domain-containing protein [Rhizocola hellebori]GIH04539.1 hypothetical protein Rhe02_26060 [Rhizocola hellebori]